MAPVADGWFWGQTVQILFMTPLQKHQEEIQKNLDFWRRKPLLQKIYAGFYQKITALLERTLPGAIVEIGSGIGNLKASVPQAICTDLFPNPWLDLVCDGYDMPFKDGSVSHLILFDVFHHLQAPMAFLNETRRVLTPGGRMILFEPYISLLSFPVYGLLHHEPVARRQAIDFRATIGRPRDYYAAQGNATRLFFTGEFLRWAEGWNIFYAKAFSAFHYLLSGGYSKPAWYPASWLSALQRVDRKLSRWPNLFGGRCLVGISPR